MDLVLEQVLDSDILQGNRFARQIPLLKESCCGSAFLVVNAQACPVCVHGDLVCLLFHVINSIRDGC